MSNTAFKINMYVISASPVAVRVDKSQLNADFLDSSGMVRLSRYYSVPKTNQKLWFLGIPMRGPIRNLFSSLLTNQKFCFSRYSFARTNKNIFSSLLTNQKPSFFRHSFARTNKKHHLFIVDQSQSARSSLNDVFSISAMTRWRFTTAFSAPESSRSTARYRLVHGV